MSNLYVKCLRCDGTGAIGSDGHTGLMQCPWCVRGFVETGWSEARVQNMQKEIDNLLVLVNAATEDGNNLKDVHRYAESHTKEIVAAKDRVAHRNKAK
jgi:hypothetical protein